MNGDDELWQRHSTNGGEHASAAATSDGGDGNWPASPAKECGRVSQ